MENYQPQPKYRDISTMHQWQFEFYCEKCDARFLSVTFPAKSQVKNEVKKAGTGFLSNMFGNSKLGQAVQNALPDENQGHSEREVERSQCLNQAIQSIGPSLAFDPNTQKWLCQNCLNSSDGN